MALFEEGNGKNAGEWACRADRQEQQITKEGRKAKEEMDINS